MPPRKLPPSLQKELDELKALAKYAKSLSGMAAGISALLPVAGVVFKSIVPPWPKSQGSSLVDTGVIPLLALCATLSMMLFLYYWYREQDHSVLHARAGCSFLLAVGCGVLYLSLFAYFVVKGPETPQNYHIRGLSLTTEASKAIDQGKVRDTPAELLGYFGVNSEDTIWEGCWLVQVVLVLAFCSVFVFLAGSFFLFTLRNFVKDTQQAKAAAASP